MEDLTGKQLGPYRVVAPLGEGGMAAVYKAYQPAMDRYVALKILPRSFADDPEFVGRFQQEAKVIAKLQHIHILAVHDYGEAEGYTYIVMPFMESGTLTGLLRGQPLPLKQISSIISQVSDALDFAHSRGIVHRDVKPSNVLVDERGNCLLTDFGIAKMVEGTAKFTVTGGIIGTPAYMSPEQGLGQKIDARSDIYALGVMLYEMATGRVPFQAETPMAIVIKHINDPLPLPRSVNPALPEAFERVILKALAKSPDDRYQTAGELARAVREAAEGREHKPPATMIETAAQTVPTVIEKPTRTSRPSWGRTRLVAAVIGVIVMAGLIVGGGVLVISQVAGRATEAPGVSLAPTTSIPAGTSEPTRRATVASTPTFPATSVVAPTTPGEDKVVVASATPALTSNIDSIVGTWGGIERVVWDDPTVEPWTGDVIATILESCNVGLQCGSLSFPTVSCSAELSLIGIEGNTFRFKRDSVTGESCDAGAEDSIQALADGTVLYFGKGDSWDGKAILQKIEN